MKIHHLRSATFLIESGEKFILIDPMLGKKGSMPPFSVIKAKAAKNPTVKMPSNA
ncbi:MBL fold metallo-hydrolase, partial [Vibrio sp. 10N.286.51.B11]